MISLFFGPNSYTRTRAVQNKSNNIEEVRKFWLGQNGALEALHEFSVFSSLFDTGKRLAIVSEVEDVFDSASLRKILERIEKNEDVEVCISESWPRKNPPVKVRGLFKGLSCEINFFDACSDREAVEFLCREASDAGWDVEKDAVAALYEMTEHDLWAAHHELEKLSLLGLVSRDLVLSHGTRAVTQPLYVFSKLLLGSRPIKADLLSGWERLIAQHTDLFGVMGYVGKVAKTKKSVSALSQADIKIKSGLLEPDQALLEVVLSSISG